MIDFQRCGGGFVVCEGAEWHQFLVCRPHIDGLETLGVLPELRVYGHDHAVLIQRPVHGGDLTLAKGIIERIVDHGGADAQPRRRGAVDDQRRFEAADLLVGVDVGHGWQGADFAQDTRRPFIEFVDVVALQGELVLGTGGASAHAQILLHLHDESGTGNAGGFAAERAITSSAATCRSSSGLSDTNMRAVLVAPPKVPPVMPTTLSTAGSSCTSVTNWRSSCCTAWNELRWSA